MPVLAESARTLLFVPGNRPDRFGKAVAAGADLVVLDLEDAVAPGDKDAARAEVRTFLTSGSRAAVRVNGTGTEWHARDIAAVSNLAAAVVIPKAEPGPALIAVARTLQAAKTPLLALIETALGVLEARAVAETAGVRRLAFGSFDLATELGTDPADYESLLPVRTTIALASAAAGLAGPIDGVWAALDDEDGLRAETARARRLGFTGKLCVHPRQVPVVREGLAPAADQIAWARSIVAALADGSGVVMRDGVMIDKPVVDRARRILGDGIADHDAGSPPS